ncbi:hypothetical protein DMUE_1808 [Dictyocoela muelleri]|nr:hypothetical protein DMUE_1808 [Dictyocoela muelleri]
MIYLTSSPLNNNSYQTISDLEKRIPEVKKNKFYLIFIDGKITFPFYKNLQQIGFDEIIIYVKNIELFNIVFNPHNGFDYDFEWLSFPENHDLYYDIEDKIKNKLKKERKNKYSKQNKYLKLNKVYLQRIDSIKQERNPIELSFYPRIFDSIRTSLMNPELYMFENNGASEIFNRAMNEKIKIEDVKDIESLNSLLFAKILVIKNDFIEVNELLL